MREKSVLLINDKGIYNERYRRPLIDEFSSRGIKVISKGIFDSKMSLLSSVREMIFSREKLVISSNLKSNLASSLLVRGRHVLILNGLGRWRKNKSARAAIVWLLTKKSRKEIIVQNYADFRYIRRFFKSASITWIPGSGGVLKKVGGIGTCVVVQRDEKIGLVSESILSIMKEVSDNTNLSIVGCKDEGNLSKLFESIKWSSVGYVDSSDIFITGGSFIQPSGYGEGFPHTLADALVSRMEVFISNREYIRYGLYRLGFEREKISSNWSKIIGFSGVDCIDKDNIASRTFLIIDKMRDVGGH